MGVIQVVLTNAQVDVKQSRDAFGTARQSAEGSGNLLRMVVCELVREKIRWNGRLPEILKRPDQFLPHSRHYRVGIFFLSRCKQAKNQDEDDSARPAMRTHKTSFTEVRMIGSVCPTLLRLDRICL